MRARNCARTNTHVNVQISKDQATRSTRVWFFEFCCVHVHVRARARARVYVRGWVRIDVAKGCFR